MRSLRVVPPGAAVLGELRAALAGGDAIFVGSATDLPDVVEQRVALVVETSGSAGRPKRVALSADALLANAAASESRLSAARSPGVSPERMPALAPSSLR